jgi:nitrite reductase/ring-hydroxylating ferredoxin subunit
MVADCTHSVLLINVAYDLRPSGLRGFVLWHDGACPARPFRRPKAPLMNVVCPLAHRFGRGPWPNGDPGIVINSNGPFYAYDAVCPHAGCTVGWVPHHNRIVCPCHGSESNVTTGDVIDGPAPTASRSSKSSKRATVTSTCNE